jgi:hypothetical protein
MDFDETRLYYSHQQLHQQSETEQQDAAVVVNEDDDSQVPVQAIRRHFREFLRT